MIEAAAALLGSAVDLGGRLYTVRAPSVLTALAVEAALTQGGPEAVVGDDEAPLLRQPLLRQACAGPDALGRPWMPPGLLAALFSDAVLPAERVRVVAECLMAGVPERDRAAARAAEAEAKGEARRLGWSPLLALYRGTYGTDPLAEPWPYFLVQWREAEAVRARAAVDWMRGYAAARSGGALLQGLFRDAGLGPQPVVLTEEEAAAERANAARVRAQVAAMKATGSTLGWEDFLNQTLVGEA